MRTFFCWRSSIRFSFLFFLPTNTQIKVASTLTFVFEHGLPEVELLGRQLVEVLRLQVVLGPVIRALVQTPVPRVRADLVRVLLQVLILVVLLMLPADTTT